MMALVVYVSLTGNDSNVGSQAAPFLTFNKAHSVIGPGDTVVFMDGLRTDLGRMNATKSGTLSARIIYRSLNKWGAKFRPAGLVGDTIFKNSGDYVDIIDLEIDGISSPEIRCGISSSGEGSRVIGNHVHHINTAGSNDGTGGAGISLDGAYYGKRVAHAINNYIHHIATPSSGRVSGIYHQSEGLIVGNVLHDAFDTSILSWHDARNLVIFGNICVPAGKWGISIGAGDFYGPSQPCDNCLIAKNIVFGFSEPGMSAGGSLGSSNQWRNNVVYGNATSGNYPEWLNIAGQIGTSGG